MIDLAARMKNIMLSTPAPNRVEALLDGLPIVAEFFDEFQQVNVAEQVVNSSSVHIRLADADLGSSGEDSLVVVKDTTYKVIGPPIVTGIGLSLLFLTEV